MSNYLVQIRYRWDTEWTTEYGFRWAKRGHLTYPGAWIHAWHLKRGFKNELAGTEVRIFEL